MGSVFLSLSASIGIGQAYAEAAALSAFLAERGCPVKKVNAVLVFAGRTVDKIAPTAMLNTVIITDYRSLIEMVGRKDAPEILNPSDRKKIVDALIGRKGRSR